MTRRLAIVFGSLWLAGALCGCAPQAEPPPLERFELGGDFQLVDHRGDDFSLGQRRGRVMLLFFGFTSCADVCPATLSKLGLVLDRLPAPGAEVLFVSVDPARDTPARLAEYVGGYPFPMTGLTGTQAQVAEVARRYAASFAPAADGTGAIDHSTRIYLIDGDGQVRFLFSGSDAVDDMVTVIERLL